MSHSIIECEGWRRHSSLIFLILLFTKPNIEVSGWLYQTKTHFTHIVHQTFSRVSPPSFTLYGWSYGKGLWLWYTKQELLSNFSFLYSYMFNSIKILAREFPIDMDFPSQKLLNYFFPIYHYILCSKAFFLTSIHFRYPAYVGDCIVYVYVCIYMCI